MVRPSPTWGAGLCEVLRFCDPPRGAKQPKPPFLTRRTIGELGRRTPASGHPETFWTLDLVLP